MAKESGWCQLQAWVNPAIAQMVVGIICRHVLLLVALGLGCLYSLANLTEFCFLKSLHKVLNLSLIILAQISFFALK